MKDIREISRVPERESRPTEEFARDFQLKMMARYAPDQLPRVVLAQYYPYGMNFVADKRDVLVRIRSGSSPLRALDELQTSSIPGPSIFEIMVMAMLDGYLGIDMVARLDESDLIPCIEAAMKFAKEPVVSMAYGQSIDLVNGTINVPRRKVLVAFLYAQRSIVERMFDKRRLQPAQREQFDEVLESWSNSNIGAQKGGLLELGLPTPRSLPPSPEKVQGTESTPAAASAGPAETDGVGSGPGAQDVSEASASGSSVGNVEVDVSPDAVSESVHEGAGIVDVVRDDQVDEEVADAEDVNHAYVGLEQAEEKTGGAAFRGSEPVIVGSFSIRASDGRSLTFESIGHGYDSLQMVATIVDASMEGAEELSIVVGNDGPVARSAYLAFLFADVARRPIRVVADGASLVAYPYSKKPQDIVEETHP